MLALTIEQFDRLEAIALERGTQRLVQVLQDAFPAAAKRAGDRFTAAVQHGIQCAARHGLSDAQCVARYLGGWLVFGAEFEAKPGFEWAAGILGSGARHQGAKVFQLCRRIGEELRQRPTAGGLRLMAAEEFDAAVATLDRELAGYGYVASMRRAPRVRLGSACDLDAIDLRITEGSWRQQYSLVGGSWQRAAVPAVPSQITLAAGGNDAAPALPERLTVLSGAVERRETVRLRIRTRAAYCCDPKVHPLVTLNADQGLAHWRGELAAELALPLHAPPAPEPPGARLQPALAAQGAAAYGLLNFSSCGLRDRGLALGELGTRLEIFPAEQLLLVWGRQPMAEMSWPEASAATPPPAVRCRLERDGQALESSRWQARLQELDRQLLESLAGLHVAWERESRVTQGQVSAEPAVMVGAAGLTCGWAETPQGIAEPPYMRVEAMADLVACRLKLRLSGRLEVAGAQSLITLQNNGEARLSASCLRKPADPDLAGAIKPLEMAFQQPFELRVEPLASEGLATLAAAGPVKGALVGRCGLRPHSAGAGLEWFAEIAIEALSAPFLLRDPAFGEVRQQRALLPATKLLDWRLG